MYKIFGALAAMAVADHTDVAIGDRTCPSDTGVKEVNAAVPTYSTAKLYKPTAN